MVTKLIGGLVGVGACIAVLGATPSSIPDAAPAAPQDSPCIFKPGTKPAPPTSTKPGAPSNLRIIGGSGGADEIAPGGFVEPDASELASGPFVPPSEDLFTADSASHAYFQMLVSRPDCHIAHPLRSQEEIDPIPQGGSDVNRDHIKWPIYDEAEDAMLQRTLNGGNAVQKQPRLAIKGTSILLTYDFKVGPGAKYVGSKSLKQYKAYRLDYGSNTGMWLSTKFNFQGAKDGYIARLLMTASPVFLGPGTTTPNSEILQPWQNTFFIRENTWTRYWLLVEGKLGGNPHDSSKPNRQEVSTEVVYLSIWAADENTAPVQLYDRIAMLSPVDDIRQFRFEFNTSESNRENPVAEFWHRNFVVLKDVTLAQAKALLQKPVK